MGLIGSSSGQKGGMTLAQVILSASFMVLFIVYLYFGSSTVFLKKLLSPLFINTVSYQHI